MENLVSDNKLQPDSGIKGSFIFFSVLNLILVKDFEYLQIFTILGFM